MKIRSLLLVGTILGSPLTQIQPARADDASASQAADIAEMKRELESLVSERKAMRAEVSELKRQVLTLQGKKQPAETAPAPVVAVAPAIVAPPVVAAAEKKPAPESAMVSMKNGRPTFTSADGNYSFSLVGRVHLDYANYFGEAHGLSLNDGFNARRVFVGLDAFVYKDLEAFIDADFGSASGNENSVTGYLHEARLTYGLDALGLGPLRVETGYMQPLSNMDDATSSNSITFLERSTMGNLSRNVAASERRFAFGARDSGDWWSARAYYTGSTIGAGNSTGVPNSATTTCTGLTSTSLTCSTSLAQASIKNEQSGASARLTALPWSDDQSKSLVHVGLNGQYVFNPDETNTGNFPRRTISLGYRPGLNVDSTNFIGTNGNIVTKTGATAAVNNATSGVINVEHAEVIGGELAGQWQNFSVQGEWTHFILETSNPITTIAASPPLNFDAAYVYASYVLSGETRGYDTAAGAFGAIKPARPFNPSLGDWGAWQIGARFEQDNLNNRAGPLLVEGGRETTYTVGLNWYWNANIRFMLDYLYTDIRRAAIVGTGANATLVAGTAKTGGIGNIGASFSGLGLRSQFTF